MHTFDTYIFADNMKPFAEYLEPEGFAKLPRKRPVEASYERCTPQTAEIARAMLKNIPYIWRWGLQMETGGWWTKTAQRAYEDKHGRTYFDRPLCILDVLRHFGGRTCAIGATDIYLPDLKYFGMEKRKEVPYKSLVRTLRVDVDMDNAYGNKFLADVSREIHMEQETAHELGLPYSVFSTAGRGHQIVIPLKVPVHRFIASFLLHLYMALLTERAEDGVHIDTHNLKKILRLPGGIHARTNKLGLWIDPKTISFYPIEMQAYLMAHGFVDSLDSGPHIMDKEEFKKSITELTAFLKTIGVRRYAELSATEFSRVIVGLPNNIYVNRFRHYSKNIGSYLLIPDISKANNSNPHREVSQTKDELHSDIQDVTWAKSYFTRGYNPGGFWNYIAPNGIKAALTLFKTKTEAEIQLIQQATRIPYKNTRDLEERISTIRGLLKTFDMNSIRQSEGFLSKAYHSLLAQVCQNIDDSKLHRQRKMNLKMVAEIMLLAYQQLESEEIDDPEWTRILTLELSSRTIALKIQQRFGNTITYRTVQNVIPYLTQGESCIFGLFRDLGHGVKFRVVNDKIPYSLGRQAKNFLKTVFD